MRTLVCIWLFFMGLPGVYGQSSYQHLYRFPSLSECLIAPAPDGTIGAATSLGYTANVFEKLVFFRLSEDGQVQWVRMYQTNGHYKLGSWERMPDGNYLAAGDYYAHNDHDYSLLFVAKVSPEGAILWIKHYQSYSMLGVVYFDRLQSAVPTADGDILIAAHSGISVGLPNEGYLLRLNDTGGIVWNKGYSPEPTPGGAAMDKDGNVIATCKGVVYKTTKDGNLLWSRIYSQSAELNPVSPYVMSDGSYVVLSNLMGGSTAPQVRVFRIEKDGTPRWVSPVFNQFSGTSIAEGPNGEVVIGGNYSGGDLIPDYHAALLKLSDDGSLGTLLRYPDSTQNMGTGIDHILPQPGGLYLSGRRYNLNHMDEPEYYLVKTDNEFATNCEEQIDISQHDIGAGLILTDLLQFDHYIGATQTFYGELPIDIGYDTICFTCRPPVVNLGMDTSFCKGDTLTLDATQRGGVKYTWNTGHDGSKLPVWESGTYIVEVETTCGKDMDTIVVQVLDLPEAKIIVSPLEAKPEDVFHFDFEGDGIQSWMWDFGDSTFSNQKAPEHSYAANGKYAVRLTVTNSLGCSRTYTQKVEVYDYKLHLPNAFTPDENALNEVFEPVGLGIHSYYMQVFNRWGGLVYEGENSGWNGHYKGRRVPQGVYLYQIIVINEKWDKETRQGLVHVVY